MSLDVMEPLMQSVAMSVLDNFFLILVTEGYSTIWTCFMIGNVIKYQLFVNHILKSKNVMTGTDC